jgi:hypothetical protein
VLHLKVNCYGGTRGVCDTLLKDGRVFFNGSTANDRVAFTETQRAIENAIHDYVKNHHASKALMVIHTALPSTSLRFGKAELATISDSEIRKNVILRKQALLSCSNLDSSRMKFVSLHYENAEKSIGYQNYVDTLKSHKNIVDFYDESKKDDFAKILGSGATYLVIDGDKTFVFFVETKVLYEGSALQNFEVFAGDYHSVDKKARKKVDYLLPMFNNFDGEEIAL